MPFSWENALASTVSFVWIVGAGRPFRVLFLKAPPGPENNPPALPPSPSWPSPELTLRLFARPYLLSRNRITLIISPSRIPSVRSTVASTSGRTLSSMESFWKICAYRSHKPTATSQERKNWNQSYSGFFGCSIVAPRADLEPLTSPWFAAALDRCRFISESGLSSSRDTPVIRSTYSRSSTDILATGTAIFTPFIL